MINIREVIQIITCMLGAMGFSVIFNVRGRKLFATGAGGALSQIVYLLVLHQYDDKVLSLFAATIVMGFLGEILARMIKTPVTILLVPMLIPLIPGSDLFYTTSYLVQGMTQECAESLSLVVKEAGAIAFGIILVTSSVQVIIKLASFLSKIKTREV